MAGQSDPHHHHHDQKRHHHEPQQRSLTLRHVLKSLAISVLVVVLLVDSSLSDISSIVNQTLSESARTSLFSVIAGIAVLSGSYVVLHDVKRIQSGLASKNNIIFLISRTMPIVQYTIIGLLILTTIQIIFMSQYLMIFVVVLLVLSWSTGVMLMGMMSFKFLQWYKAKRNILLLLYAASSLMFCSTLGATIVPQSLIMLQSAPSIGSNSAEVKPFQANPQTLDILFAVISVANWLVVPLVFTIWTATAVMLNSYSKQFGTTKYWIMISVPLVSLIVGVTFLLIFLPSLSSIFDEKVIPYTMMAFGGILAEGFLLSFAFLTVSQSIRKADDNNNSNAHGKITNYLDISAGGVAILFVSFFANPSAGSYLPFGTVAASFFSFGAYLFFSGIYSSAVSISSDRGLLENIRKSLLDQSRLLDDIGMASMYDKLTKQVEDIVEKHREDMKQETGIESSVSEVDMKNYVEEIIAEIQENKSRGGKQPANAK